MTWSQSQQLRLEAILAGRETRPSIYDRSRTHNRRDEMPDVPEVDMTFDDVVDIVNPLHHVPLVGTGYRAVTGDTISPHAQMIGDVLYGGPTAIFSAGVNAAIRQETGQDAGQLALAAVNGDLERSADPPARQAPALTVAAAPTAGETVGPPVAQGAARQMPTGQAPIAQVPRAQAASVDLAPVPAGAQTAELVAAAPRVYAPAPAAAAAPVVAPAAEAAGPAVSAELPAAAVARVAPPAGAIAAYATRAPAASGPSISPAQVDTPVQAPSVAAGPQVGAGPTVAAQPAQPARPSPGGGPVEISVTLDAALMALAGNPGGVTAGPPAAMPPAAAAPAERLRQADTAYRRGAGAVAVY
ncbi:MAG: hypothetical protein H6843_09045 [Rhodospirillaceae bacterium]|nr:hypothetical protein [Rhodospirillaceae bacterium]